MASGVRNRRRVVQTTPGEVLTKQAFAQDADVNRIVERHMRGVGRSLSNIGVGGTRQPIFGDFSSIDYHDMLNTVSNIDNVFSTLPARIRSRFRNRPELAIAFCEDPNNLKEAVKLGLMVLPEGQVMTEEGEIVEQGDLVKEAEKPPVAPNVAPKEDPKAQPTNTGGAK